MKYMTGIRWGLPLLGLMLAACEGAPVDERPARLEVTIQGLNSTLEIEVPAGEYMIEAEGQAEDGTATIELNVVDREGDRVAGGLVQLSTAEAGARDGDRGAGTAPVTALPGAVTDVPLVFEWDSQTPDSGWNIDLRFQRGPDVEYWTVSPAPYMVAGRPFEMIMGVSSEDLPADLSFECEFEGGVDCSDFRYDGSMGAYRGRGVAPDVEGEYDLRLVVEDSSGATELSKMIQVVAWDAVLLAPGRQERRLGGGVLDNGAHWELVEVSAPPFTDVTEFRYDANGDGDTDDPGDSVTTKEGTLPPLGDAGSAPQGADADGDNNADTHYILVDGVNDGQRQGSHVFVVNQNGTVGFAEWRAP